VFVIELFRARLLASRLNIAPMARGQGLPLINWGRAMTVISNRHFAHFTNPSSRWRREKRTLQKSGHLEDSSHLAKLVSLDSLSAGSISKKRQPIWKRKRKTFCK